MPVLMPSVVFRWFVPAQSGSGLVPANGYKVEFYSAGTTTPKQVYDGDDVPAPAPGNIMTLNDEGFVAIKLGPGLYKIIVTEPDGTPVYTQDNIPGAGSFSTGFVGQVIASDDPATNGLAELDTTSNLFTYAAGYYESGDGGEGMFYQVTSSQADDGGYCIASTFDPTKRWLRIPDESGKVRAASFGAILTLSDDITSAMQAADVYASSKGETLLIEKGSIATIASLTFDSLVEFGAGAVLTGNASPVTDLIFNSIVTGSRDLHFFIMHSVIFATAQVNDSPEWFGVDPAAGDNTAALTAWFATSRGVIILPPGTYAYAGFVIADLPAGVSVLYGTIGALPPGLYFPDGSTASFTTFRLKNGWELSDLDTGAQTGGDLTINGTLEAVNDVIAGGNATITGAITGASTTVTGTTQAAILEGTTASATKFRAGGVIGNFDGSTDIKAGTSSTTILANTLSADTMIVKVYASGTHSDITNLSVVVALQGVTLATFAGFGTGLSGSGSWVISGHLKRVSSTTAKFVGSIAVYGGGTSGGAASGGTPSSTVAATWSSNAAFTFHQSGSAACTLNTLTLELVPVSPQ